MSQGYKICPICGTPAHRNATLCSTCGTSLSEVEVVSGNRKASTEKSAASRYDRRYGETDLLEGELHRRSEVYVFGGALVLLAVICVGAVAFAGVRWLLPAAADTPTANPIATQPAIALETNTPAPTPVMATVTPPPPTATNTPTPGPCTHTVQTGDDLISIAWECGHRSLDVMPLILELNNLTSPEMIQVGQEILVPWPTEVGAPTEAGAATQEALEGGTEDVESAFFSASEPTEMGGLDLPGLAIASAPTQGTPTVAPTQTLLPGIEYYVVQPNENILSIVYAYNTSVQVLSQLNPEITFSQCEFGSPVGGPECNVMIYAGQQIRVPAPTPTPSLSPTLSGSETPTPTATPTFNAPSAISPSDRALFMRGELITLRWVGSGTLGDGETYRVRVEDLTAVKIYTDDTTALSYILPSEWQGQDGQRHDYRWSVSVIRSTDPDNPIFTTEPRRFTWEGR